MRWLRSIVCLSLAVFWASGARAELVDPPTCTNALGETVVFETRQGARVNFAAGMANRAADGTPTVYRMNYQSAVPTFQRFIDLHECAHHQTGDVDRPHPPRNSPAHLMNESIADCIAILRLRDENDDPETALNALIPALQEAMSAVGFPDISTDSRIDNLRHCYQNYGPANVYIEGILASRK